MSLRILGILVLLALLIVLGIFLFPSKNAGELQRATSSQITLAPPGVDDEISERLVERFIAEDEDIQKALKADAPAILSATAEQAVLKKSKEDILYELMAPWVYIQVTKINRVTEGRFYNTNNKQKTPWLPVGGTLAGTKILSMNSDVAVVELGDVSQELLLVALEPPVRFDPSVPRTPEQVADAQRRYQEFYYKKFVVMGKKYDELRGKTSVNIPPREEQLQQGIEYMDSMIERVSKDAPLPPPPGSVVDTSNMTDQQREAYEAYQRVLQRPQDELITALEQQRDNFENSLQALEGSATTLPDGQP